MAAIDDIDGLPAQAVESTVRAVEKMPVVGALFAAVGYLLVGFALILELTRFHPLPETFFSE